MVDIITQNYSSLFSSSKAAFFDIFYNLFRHMVYIVPSFQCKKEKTRKILSLDQSKFQEFICYTSDLAVRLTSDRHHHAIQRSLLIFASN
jgi:hypothetical protein